MDWNGSFLIMSILLHVLLIAGATFLIVHVVQGRKETLKFTAPPPAPPAAEHKVKPTKKNAAAPAVSKRITTTAVNVSVSLPPVDLSSPSTQAPDLMASVMAGMGQGSLGAGALAGGVSALPSGFTSFGFRGATNGGLVGHFYDLTQTSDRKRAPLRYLETVKEFVDKGWDESVLKKYYRAPDSMLAVQFFMPCSTSSGAAKAFNVEKEAPNPTWVVHYKGVLIPTRDMEMRFWCTSDDFCIVRVGGQVVGGGTQLSPGKPQDPKEIQKVFPTLNGIPGPPANWNGIWHWYGDWFTLKRNEPMPIEVLIGDSGGLYNQILLAEEKNPPDPYPYTTGAPKALRLPLVQFRRGVPLPAWDPKAQMVWDGVTRITPYERNPQFTDRALVIPSK
jgi:hypothetical protein